MDYTNHLALSYYRTIATINSDHKVYLVQHQESQKIYVKKILDIYNPQIYEYLHGHTIKGIPKLYDIYEENGQLTIIEEYISGTSLQEIIDSEEITLEFVIRIIYELCDILSQLHKLNPPIVHRDIKPSNIIITSFSHVVLLDFNAAKYAGNKSSASDTMLLGTKGYAAPEQYGFGSSTPQTDIYALGILLRELTNALPETTESLNSIIKKCTQINPSDRFENIASLISELNKSYPYVTNNIHPSLSSTGSSYRFPGFRTGSPWKMLTASVFYLLLLWLCFSLEIKNATPLQLWIERISYLLINLSVILCWFNYGNLWRIMPFSKSRHRILRYCGILLSNVLIIFLILILMGISLTII